MSLRSKLRYSTFLSAIVSIYRNYFSANRKKMGYIHPTAIFRQPILIKGVENVYLSENCQILGHAIILSTLAKFIMKKNSIVAEGLTVVTGNHQSIVGRWMYEIADNEKSGNMDKDVIVEEDVWIASNVTLLSGVTIGRGSIIGSGAVIRNNVPPYAIIMGNPGRVVGFRFNPEEVIEHEKALYPEEERIPLRKLSKNYEKYFFDRRAEIADYMRI